MTIERKTQKKLCQKCSLLGVQSALQLFQVNDDEAILMCKNVDCTFMSSPSWENLVVKRNASRLSSGSGAKKFPALRKAQSVCSLSQPTRSDIRTTQSLGSSSTISRQSLLHSSVETSRSPTPVNFEEEKRTLVPFAPFLCGHAHSFSSFETKRIEKGQLCNSFDSPSYTSAYSNTSDTLKNGSFAPGRHRSVIGKNRRSSSIESESLSSGSLDSRPTTPTFSTQVTGGVGGDKVRKLIVPPETLAKILDGSLKVKLVRSSKSKGNQVTNCYPVAQTRPDPDSISIETGDLFSQPVTPASSHSNHSLLVNEAGIQSNTSHLDVINNFVESERIDSLDISLFTTISQVSPPNSNSGSFDFDPHHPLANDFTSYQPVNSTDRQRDSPDNLLSSFAEGLEKDSEDCTDFVFDTSLFCVSKDNAL